MQKILLVNPPAFIEETYSRYAMGAPELPPLGLAYVASMVRQDHDVRILDCVARRMGLRQFCEEVRRWSPDIVAPIQEQMPLAGWTLTEEFTLGPLALLTFSGADSSVQVTVTLEASTQVVSVTILEVEP